MSRVAYDEEPELGPSHPDGEPWRKACRVCALRRENPQDLSEEDFAEMAMQEALGGLEFVCVHRTTAEGYYRGCACWAALNRVARRRRAAESATLSRSSAANRLAEPTLSA